MRFLEVLVKLSAVSSLYGEGQRLGLFCYLCFYLPNLISVTGFLTWEKDLKWWMILPPPLKSQRKRSRKKSMAVSFRRVQRIQFPNFYLLLQSNLAYFLLLPAVGFCCLVWVFFCLHPVKYFQWTWYTVEVVSSDEYLSWRHHLKRTFSLLLSHPVPAL